MWKDIALMFVFWIMILAPCMVAVNAGEWGTDEDGGYQRANRED